MENKRPLDGSSFFVRKDKQANTTGAHNAAVGSSSFFVRKDKQAGRRGLAGSFLSEKTSKQDAVARSQGSFFVRKDKQAIIQGPWSKLLQTRTKNLGQRTKEQVF